jgi:hypothetical protein
MSVLKNKTDAPWMTQAARGVAGRHQTHQSSRLSHCEASRLPLLGNRERGVGFSLAVQREPKRL